MASQPGGALPNRSQTGLFPMLRPSFGTATHPTGTSVASRRGEGGLLTGLRHGHHAHKCFRDIPAWRRGSSDRSSARRPCPQVLQRHPGVAKGVFQPVFGTGTLPTGTPEASPRGKTIMSSTSLRLVTFTEQAHHAHRPLRGRLPCAVKPIGPHRASEYALHLP